MENNKNNDNIKLNEDMLSDDIIDEHEEKHYNKMEGNGGKKPNNKNNKKKIIGGIIAAIVAIGLISGFLLYLNGNKQSGEVKNLVEQIRKNTLSKENAQYLQNKKYVNQDQLDKLETIVQKAGDSNGTLDQIKNLVKEQLGILNPINKKLGDSDSQFTKSLKYNLGLLAGLGGIVKNVINVDDIKKIVNEKFDLQKLVNENTPVIKKKDEALSMIRKVAFDKNALMKGDFSSIAGTYVNSEGKEIVINKQGTTSNNDGCKGSKPKLNKLGYYTWGISCSGGSKGSGFFFPIGIPVTLGLDGGKTKIVSSDIKKNRIMFGNQLGDDSKSYYARK